ncbi:Translocation protein SEC62 [Trichinella pseudospiralis]|uniref:Translocation protein SEC62 n=1 Tax=Trichinella pseudospiralis TaxID=6337 RepID=A0A0V1JUG9_TRIPS|nr:Translocation protein SEC62 [Trichinella pseudospiralis]
MGNKRRLKRREKPSEMSMKPTKLEYGVAKYLRFNCPTKTTTYFGNDLHYFNGCKAVDTLLESNWAHGKDDLFLNTRQSCVDYLQGCRFDVLIDKGFFFHARKLVPKKRDPGLSRSSLQDKKQTGDVQKSDGESPSKKARRVKIEFHDDQSFVDGNNASLIVYVWQYDPTSTRAFLIGILLVIGSILVCLFPLWPQQFRICVYYLSMAVMCFMVRLLLFVIIWICTMGKHHLWLLPNLLEDCSVVESFKPLYAYTYHGKDAEERKEKNAKADNEADNDESNDERDSEDDDDSGKEKQSPSELCSTSEDENKETCEKQFSKNREKTELQSDSLFSLSAVCCTLTSQFDMSNRGIGSNAASPESDPAERKRLREFQTKLLRQQMEKEDHERRLKALREAEQREERVRKAKDLQKLKRTLELHCQNEERQRKVLERRAQLENERADKRKDAELMKTRKNAQKPALLKCRSATASKYAFGSSTPRSFSYMGKSVAAHLAAEVSGAVNRAGQKGVGLSTKMSVRGVGPGRDAAMATSLYSLPKRENTAHATDSMTMSITIGESSRFVSARNVRQNNSTLPTDLKRVAQSGLKAVQRRAVSNRTSVNVAAPPPKKKIENSGISKPSENESTAELLDNTCENRLLSLTSQSVKEDSVHERDLSDHTEFDLTKSKSDVSILEETAQVQEETDESEISSFLLTTSPSVESRTASVLESVGKTPTDQTRSMGKVNGGGNEVSVNVNAKGVKLLTEEEALAALSEKRRLIREQRIMKTLEKMERTSESIGKKEPEVEEKVVELTPTIEEQQRQEEVLERKDTERSDIKKKINEILTRARMGAKALETSKFSDGSASLPQLKTPKSEISSDKNLHSNSLAVLEKLATSGRSIGPSLESILNRVRSPLIYASNGGSSNSSTANAFSNSVGFATTEQSTCSSSINGDASQFGASVSAKTAGESVFVDSNANSFSYESSKSASTSGEKSETDESELVNNIKKMVLDDDSSADLSSTTITTTSTTTTVSSDDVIDENANG